MDRNYPILYRIRVFCSSKTECIILHVSTNNNSGQGQRNLTEIEEFFFQSLHVKDSKTTHHKKI